MTDTPICRVPGCGEKMRLAGSYANHFGVQVESWLCSIGGPEDSPYHQKCRELVDERELCQSCAEELRACMDEKINLETKVKNQRVRLVYLEGATNHGAGTPLSIAKAEVQELKSLLETHRGLIASQLAQIEAIRSDNAAIRAQLAARDAELAEVVTHAASLLNEIKSLMDESGGVYGMHLNGDLAPWSELEAGGQFERLTSLDDLDAALAREEARRNADRQAQGKERGTE